MAIGKFFKGVGKALGLVPPSTRERAGIDVIRTLRPELYQYQPGAFEVGPVSGAEGQAARQEMADFTETLRRRATGEAPSLAELQLQAGQQASQQSLMSALSGLRGRQAGLGIRGLQQQFAEQGQTLSQQLAQMRAAEQSAAEQQLAQFLAQRAQTAMGAQELAFREALARQQALAELERLRGADIAALLGIGQTSAQAEAARRTQVGGSLIGAIAAGAAKPATA